MPWWKYTLVCVRAMSNSLLPYGLYPSRLLCPQDSPGKNIGVGCHALLLPNPRISIVVVMLYS